jgi:hypothetical protein
MQQATQIQECVENLLQIKETLTILHSSNQSSIPLLHAHHNLLSALVALHELPSFEIGSVVLAPRSFHGMITEDLAVIVSKQSDKVDEAIEYRKVIWLRPSTAFELESNGSIFPITQINANGKSYYDLQTQTLLNIRTGDKVLVRLENQGLWTMATVMKFDDDEQIMYVNIKDDINHGNPNFSNPSSSSSSSSSSEYPYKTIQIPNNISYVAPLPRMYINQMKTKSKQSQIIKHDFDEQDDELAHYIDLTNYSTKMDTPIIESFDKIEGFAEWEKYTKGIGSRLLQKMGYKR